MTHGLTRSVLLTALARCSRHHRQTCTITTAVESKAWSVAKWGCRPQHTGNEGTASLEELGIGQVGELSRVTCAAWT